MVQLMILLQQWRNLLLYKVTVRWLVSDDFEVHRGTFSRSSIPMIIKGVQIISSQVDRTAVGRELDHQVRLVFVYYNICSSSQQKGRRILMIVHQAIVYYFYEICFLDRSTFLSGLKVSINKAFDEHIFNTFTGPQKGRNRGWAARQQVTAIIILPNLKLAKLSVP